MNTPRLAHISISIFRRRSVLFCESMLLPHISSSVGIVYLFVCPRQRVQEKHKKKGRETTHFFSDVCLRLVSWIVNTHTQFFPRLSSYIIRTKEKNGLMENVCAFTRRQREKKEKRRSRRRRRRREKDTHTPETRMAALVLGLKKRKGTSKLVFSTSRGKERYEWIPFFLSLCFSFVLARHNSIASDNKISQWKEE